MQYGVIIGLVSRQINRNHSRLEISNIYRDSEIEGPEFFVISLFLEVDMFNAQVKIWAIE